MSLDTSPPIYAKYISLIFTYPPDLSSPKVLKYKQLENRTLIFYFLQFADLMGQNVQNRGNQVFTELGINPGI